MKEKAVVLSNYEFMRKFNIEKKCLNFSVYWPFSASFFCVFIIEDFPKKSLKIFHGSNF